MACFPFFHYFGSGLRLVAWRLMHASGQAHLLHLSRGFPLFDLGLEPFSVTAADADCYYVALGGEKGALALQFIALPGDNCRKYESRISFSYKYINLRSRIKSEHSKWLAWRLTCRRRSWRRGRSWCASFYMMGTLSYT